MANTDEKLDRIIGILEDMSKTMREMKKSMEEGFPASERIPTPQELEEMIRKDEARYR